LPSSFREPVNRPFLSYPIMLRIGQSSTTFVAVG